MVFKRRDKRSVFTTAKEFLWPRGGWARAFYYIRHRLQRLPGQPETIARGIAAGVFTTFTPFYGLHLITAALIARVIQGNILAALLGTFFGNPLTYLPIGVVSLQLGHFFLGNERVSHGEHLSFFGKFVQAAEDLRHNLVALFTGGPVEWDGLELFFSDVFLPYMVGGIVPGLITSVIVYYLSVPLLRAYQTRRKGALKERLLKLKNFSSKSVDGTNRMD